MAYAEERLEKGGMHELENYYREKVFYNAVRGYGQLLTPFLDLPDPGRYPPQVPLGTAVGKSVAMDNSLVFEMGFHDTDANMDVPNGHDWWAVGYYYGEDSANNKGVIAGNEYTLCQPAMWMNALYEALKQIEILAQQYPDIKHVKIITDDEVGDVLGLVFARDEELEKIEVVAGYYDEQFQSQLDSAREDPYIKWSDLEAKDIQIKLWIHPEANNAKRLAKVALEAHMARQAMNVVR